MKSRDVGEADYPFGVVLKGKGRELVEVVNHTVAATRTENCTDIGVGESRHEVGKSLGMGTAEVAVLTEGVGIDDRIVAQTAKHLGG